jgi:hypothetical protein
VITVGRVVAPLRERAPGWRSAGAGGRVEPIDEFEEGGLEAGAIAFGVGADDVDDFSVAVGCLLIVAPGLVDHAEAVPAVVHIGKRSSRSRATFSASEDLRRSHRERSRLVRERTAHINRIKGLLFAQGIRDINVKTRYKTLAVDELGKRTACCRAGRA